MGRMPFPGAPSCGFLTQHLGVRNEEGLHETNPGCRVNRDDSRGSLRWRKLPLARIEAFDEIERAKACGVKKLDQAAT